MKKSTGPRSYPCGTSDKTGTRSDIWPSKTTRWKRPDSHELIHLWVDPGIPCLICIIASCVEPCQRPWWNPLQWYLFVQVHDLQHHQGYLQYHVQTGQAVFHTTFDFGKHADSQQECSLRLDVCLYCLRLYAPGSCSICMWAAWACNLRGHTFPLFLYMGATFAGRQSYGTEPWASEAL